MVNINNHPHFPSGMRKGMRGLQSGRPFQLFPIDFDFNDVMGYPTRNQGPLAFSQFDSCIYLNLLPM